MIFEALADPTRRWILDDLRQRGTLSVSDVAGPIDMSRQAVTKHLNLLVRSGLVTVHWEGRCRMHSVDPEPLLEVQDWLAPYAAEWDRRLARLERHLGERDTTELEESNET
jgi:DNA-binding transcriptional ArsR family regulator